MFFKNFFLMSILTAVVVASWIGFSVWHNVNTSTIDKDLQIKISPIPEKFETGIIEKLRTRKQVQIDMSAAPLFLDNAQTRTSSTSAQQDTIEFETPSASEPAEFDPGIEL